MGEEIVPSECATFACDLGLGFGLKPGGLPKTERLDLLGTCALLSSPLTDPEPSESPPGTSRGLLNVTLSSNNAKLCPTAPSRNDVKENIITKTNRWFSPRRRFSLRVRRPSSYSTCSDSDVMCPVNPSNWPFSPDRRGEYMYQDCNNDCLTLQCSLQKAQQEIDDLRVELETSQQQQLHSRCGTVQILKNESMEEQGNQRQLAEKAGQVSRKLEKEVNRLQWELDVSQRCLLDSEQTWAARFDHVATENAALLVALHTQADELQRLGSENRALTRERDELAAALDVRDSFGYDSCYPDGEAAVPTTEIMLELAILGACQCRGLEPCSCARVAAAARRQTSQLKKELQRARRSHEEALLAADAYRAAFERQLSEHTSRIHDLLAKSSWRKAWRSGGTVTPPPSCQDDPCLAEQRWLVAGIEAQKEEIVEKLVDMLSDKVEAMAHQRVTVKRLAAKMQSLEKMVDDLSIKRDAGAG